MLPASGTLLDQGNLNPVVLMELTHSGGTLRFCTDRAVEHQGHVYQPYLQGIGTLRTAANFPENSTSNKEYQFQFENGPITWAGTNYPYLSHTFDVFPWELAGANVSLLLYPNGSATTPTVYPLVASGITGVPGEVTRESFSLAVCSRNVLLNDLLPMRQIRSEEFPEADRDELNGRVYIPIVIGESVRVRARATGAGATTTITTEVSTGTTLDVSETEGFEDGDSIIINGFLADPFTIGTVDAGNNQFTGLSPNLATLGTTIRIGTVVREDKASYDYTLANHKCGDILEVRVTPHGGGEPTVIDPSLYTKVNVSDANAIGGIRTDLSIPELFPFGAEATVTQQPVATVDGGNHVHNTAVSQENTVTSFAGSTSGPTNHGNANDGNADTATNVQTGGVSQDILTFSSFPSLAGTFVSQRYYAVMSGPVVTGDVRIRRGANTFLTLSAGFAKGEFRSTLDTGGSATSDFTIVVQTDPTNALVYEGWKEVTTSPSVSEDTIDLTNTTRTQDVEIDVSGANVEVGDVVEVLFDGAVDDASGAITGSPNAVITRPDHVLRWFLQRALGQTTAIIDLDSYQDAGSALSLAGTEIRFALEDPIKLDALFDQMADNSGLIHWWGRDGHNIRVLEDADSLPAAVAEFTEDTHGVMSLTWHNAFTANEIRNKLTAFYGKDFTRSVGKDESYAGSVAARDLDSQARYGVRGNEVSDTDKAFYFDMVPTAEQAQTLLNLIAGHKAFPRKDFDLTTEWSAGHLLEPGDIVEIDSPTLLAPVNARIMEHVIDPNFLCQITAREAGGVAEATGHANTGLHSPASAASVGPGDRAWTNPGNAFSSNNAYAVASMLVGEQFTEYLQLTNFGFAIPSDAIIDGVEVLIERKETGAGVVGDHENFLVINNAIAGDSRVDIFTAWPATDTLKTYGASDDTWTNSLTPAIVNSSGFGVAIKALNNDFGSLSAAPNVDHAQLKVYYHTT